MADGRIVVFRRGNGSDRPLASSLGFGSSDLLVERCWESRQVAGVEVELRHASRVEVI